ncbi:MAG: amino acid permease, partial [Sulfurimonadaceae bacterium]|nr:amino acid permease [Sulfurimonadaceae bacterium]
EDMVNIAEEVKEPSRTFPMAMIMALVISTLLYLSIALVGVLVLPPEELGASHAPFAAIFSHTTGREATFIAYISIAAVINGAMIQIIMASRMVYGLSKRGWLPNLFAYVNEKTQTPLTATLAVVLVTIAFALWLPLVSLANLSSSLILVVFTVVNIALIRIKLRGPKLEGSFSIPIWVPITGTILNLSFLAVQHLTS